MVMLDLIRHLLRVKVNLKAQEIAGQARNDGRIKQINQPYHGQSYYH